MIDTAKIAERMEVVAADGKHVGTVDHMEGRDMIKLTRNDPVAKGLHHYVPFDWVETVDEQVHLSKDSDEIFQSWRN
jgi:hypothetical protein